MFTLKASLFILKDYPLELFTWGSNTNFTLGHRDESTRYAPEIVECGEGDAKLFIKEVSYHFISSTLLFEILCTSSLLWTVLLFLLKVVMGKFHSVFLSTDGRIFTCGHGRGGRLGHSNEETLLVN